MLVNALDLDEVRVAILTDEDGARGGTARSANALDQIYFETRARGPAAGNIYKGRITNFERSLEAAFVDLGVGKHGFLHVSDVSLEGASAGRRARKDASGRGASERERRLREHLSSGREIIVQVRKEGVGDKGPSLTTFLGLPGRYLVLMPSLKRIGVSKRITDRALREELKRTLADLRPLEGLGFVIRTEARGVSVEEIRRDADSLLERWHAITEQSRTIAAPALLWAEADLVERAVRDYLSADTSEIWVDSSEAYARVRDYLAANAPRLTKSCHIYEGAEPLFKKFGVESQMRGILDHRVKLPGGGEIVVERTEAMVVVDVNSGRSRHRADSASMILQTNLEAAREVTRQLRLRDLGGLIVIDFIDMESAKDRAAVEAEVEKALRPDKARTTVLEISEFGLLQMTRQRRGEALEKRLSQRCTHCDGKGFVRSIEAVSLSLLRDLRAHVRSEAGRAGSHASKRLKLTATLGPERALAVANRLRAEIGHLEEAGAASVVIETDPAFGPDQFSVASAYCDVEKPPVPAAAPSSPVEQAPSASPAASGKKKKKARRRRRRPGRRHAKTTENT
jgi:ribonuclease E